MEKLVIALYSDDSTVRASVIAAVGKQLDPALAPSRSMPALFFLNLKVHFKIGLSVNIETTQRIK